MACVYGMYVSDLYVSYVLYVANQAMDATSWAVLLLAVFLLVATPPVPVLSQSTVVLQTGRAMVDLYNNSVSTDLLPP